MIFESDDVTGSIIRSSYTKAEVEIGIKQAAAPGPRRFRLASPRGVSNAILFRVSRWPTPVEREPNDDPDSAMSIQTPCLLNGRLETPEDVDFYRFHANAGERLQFNVLGARNGNSTDLSLAILTPEALEMTHDEGRLIWDPYVDQTFEEEGDYLAVITLTRMPAGGQSRTNLNYQLGVGRSPFLWSVFPLGGQRATLLTATLRGDFLQRGKGVLFSETGRAVLDTIHVSDVLPEGNGYQFCVKLDPTCAVGVAELSVDDPSGTLAPLSFVVGDLPEKIESEPNNSQAQAEKLIGATTINGRMDKDGDEDWFQISAASGDRWMLTVDAEKIGSPFDSLLELLDGSGRVLESSDDAKLPGRKLNRDSEISYKFEESGDYWIRLTSLYGHGSLDQNYRLTVRPARPDFLVSVTSDRPTVIAGRQGKLGISIARINEFIGDVRLRVRGLPQGVEAESLVLSRDQNTANLTLKASPEVEVGGFSEISVEATAIIDGREIVHKAILPEGRMEGSGPGFARTAALKAYLGIAESPRFSLESAASTIYLVRGNTAEFGLKVTRRSDFQNSIRLTAENLPVGVSIESAEWVDTGRLVKITLRAATSTPSGIVPNLVMIGNATWDGGTYSTASPKIGLQVN